MSNRKSDIPQKNIYYITRQIVHNIKTETDNAPRDANPFLGFFITFFRNQ